jgi:hypothetical protein
MARVNLTRDAVYPSTRADADGATLVGANTYVVISLKVKRPC